MIPAAKLANADQVATRWRRPCPRGPQPAHARWTSACGTASTCGSCPTAGSTSGQPGSAAPRWRGSRRRGAAGSTAREPRRISPGGTPGAAGSSRPAASRTSAGLGGPWTARDIHFTPGRRPSRGAHDLGRRRPPRRSTTRRSGSPAASPRPSTRGSSGSTTARSTSRSGPPPRRFSTTSTSVRRCGTETPTSRPTRRRSSRATTTRRPASAPGTAAGAQHGCAGAGLRARRRLLGPAHQPAPPHRAHGAVVAAAALAVGPPRDRHLRARGRAVQLFRARPRARHRRGPDALPRPG